MTERDTARERFQMNMMVILVMAGALLILSLIVGLFLLRNLGKEIDEGNGAELPVIGSPDHHITDTITFLTHDSLPLTFGDIASQYKIMIVDFFFTRCPHICPALTASMKKVYEEVGGDEGVVLISVSVDPSYDRPYILRQYREKHEIEDASNWLFLTGDSSSIYAMIRRDFLSAIQYSPDPAELLHTSYFYLIDGGLRIRGVYRGLHSEDVQKLLKDYRRLRKELEMANP